jgi:hypothetical protein
LIDDLGMVPAFNMLGRGNRLHGKGFGMMQNLDSTRFSKAVQAA